MNFLKIVPLSIIIITLMTPGQASAAVSWEANFNFPPQDAQGWSILTPTSDSRLIYVSNSGDDSTGQIYSPSDSVIGSDPKNPTGSVQAFGTIDAALTNMRSGSPDWVLLRKGDTWSSGTIKAKSGLSLSERSVITSYGSASDRPLINSGQEQGLSFWKSIQFSALIGIEFYSNERDPGGPDFAGWEGLDGGPGFYMYSSNTDAPNSSILVEDSVFNFFGGNIVQGPAGSEDIIIRRSQFLNNYSTNSHSQGLYSNNASVFLEENLFDHNGWYKHALRIVKIKAHFRSKARYWMVGRTGVDDSAPAWVVRMWV
jgi:hypothetical protein